MINPHPTNPEEENPSRKIILMRIQDYLRRIRKEKIPREMIDTTTVLKNIISPEIKIKPKKRGRKKKKWGSNFPPNKNHKKIIN